MACGVALALPALPAALLDAEDAADDGAAAVAGSVPTCGAALSAGAAPGCCPPPKPRWVPLVPRGTALTTTKTPTIRQANATAPPPAVQTLRVRRIRRPCRTDASTRSPSGGGDSRANSSSRSRRISSCATVVHPIRLCTASETALPHRRVQAPDR